MENQNLIIDFMRNKSRLIFYKTKIPDYFTNDDAMEIMEWDDNDCKEIINKMIDSIDLLLTYPRTERLEHSFDNDQCPFCLRCEVLKCDCKSCEYGIYHGACLEKESTYQQIRGRIKNNGSITNSITKKDLKYLMNILKGEIPVKKKMHQHPKARMHQRVSEAISQYDIERVIKDRNYVSAKAENNQRSIIYGKVNEIPFKALLRRMDKKIITFLDIHYLFETRFYFIADKLNIYRIKIFPDCYMETENNQMMTIFERFNSGTGEWDEKSKRSDLFDKYFNLIWNNFKLDKPNDAMGRINY